MEEKIGSGLDKVLEGFGRRFEGFGGAWKKRLGSVRTGFGKGWNVVSEDLAVIGRRSWDRFGGVWESFWGSKMARGASKARAVTVRKSRERQDVV